MSETRAANSNQSKRSDQHYDAVIVGAGFAGALVAQQLARAGHRVLILEAGRSNGISPENYRTYLDNYYRALAKVPNSPYPDNPDAPSPTVTEIAKIPWPQPATSGYMVQNGRLPFSSDYERAAGGTSLHWLGCCPRMLPNDFHMDSTYGVGCDWPLSYDELQPYYSRFEWEIGVSGDVDDQQFFGVWFDENYRYPMRRLPHSYLDQRVTEGVKGMKVRVGDELKEICLTSMPQGRNSVPNHNPLTGELYRPQGMAGEPLTGERCEGNASCVPICPVQAKYNSLKTLSRLPKNLVEIRTQAVATRIEIDPDTGRVAGIVYTHYTDPNSPRDTQTQTATGTLYIVAAHAIETAKLLLASNAANSSDQVGRNLMDHPTMLTWGLMPEPIGAYRGPGSTGNIYTLRDGAFRSRHAACIIPLDNWGWTWAAFDPGVTFGNMVNQQGLFGTALRRSVAGTFPRQFALQFEFEQLPDPNNRVTIDPKYRDALGNYRPVITYDLDDYTRKAMVTGSAVSREVFRHLGVKDCTSYSESDPNYLTYEGEGFVFRGAGHCVGTHRMGDCQCNSVTDTHLRAWDHPNLYLVGCGSMPTIGTSNPTPTMAALALRAADRMLEDLK